MKHYICMHIITFCFFYAIQPMEYHDDTNGSPKEVIVESASNKVPNLNLSHTQGSDSTPNSRKIPIKKLTDFDRAISGALTTGRTTAGSGTTAQNTPHRSRGIDPVSSTTHGDSPPMATSILTKITSQVDNPDIPAHQRSLLPKAMKTYSGQKLLQQEKFYSEEEIWDKLATFNPVLHSFGKKHNMNIEQLEEFATFLQENDVHPNVLTEYTHITNALQNRNAWKRFLIYCFGDADKKRFNNSLQHFEKIKKENPDNWQELVLEFMKIKSDQANGFNQRSKIDDIQTEFLTKDNADQAHQIHVRSFVVIVQFLAGVGMTAWGIYGQTYPNCTNSTM